MKPFQEFIFNSFFYGEITGIFRESLGKLDSLFYKNYWRTFLNSFPFPSLPFFSFLTYPRVPLNSIFSWKWPWSSSLLPSIWGSRLESPCLFMQCWDLNLGICGFYVSILLNKIHHNPPWLSCCYFDFHSTLPLSLETMKREKETLEMALHQKSWTSSWIEASSGSL